MYELVELKFWQFLALLLLAGYGLLQLVILPLIQRYVYRRFQATERILDEELKFGLPTYALANRRLWIDRLLTDPEVREVIKEVTEEGDIPAHLVLKKARDYADEIVPSFNAMMYFRIAHWLARNFLRMLYWVKVAYNSRDDYEEITDKNCVVMVTNHRSNFDPLLVIYMTSQRIPVSYSAGEWAAIFPFRQLLHALGFYIVRRDRSGDKIYHSLLRRYVFLSTSHCVPQGLFLEGGLTRDGKMLPLKLGLLNYIVRAHQQDNCEDIIFIPAALNYDRIPEFRSLIANRDKGFGNKGGFYSLMSFIRFLGAVTTYMLPRRHKPFGYTCVNFGDTISLTNWQKKNKVEINKLSDAGRRKAIGDLGRDLARDISRLIPILPTNILAKVFEESKGEPLSEFELKIRATNLIKKLMKKKITVLLPKNEEDYALGQGIYILIRENIIEPTGDGRFMIVEHKIHQLEYYSNQITELTAIKNI